MNVSLVTKNKKDNILMTIIDQEVLEYDSTFSISGPEFKLIFLTRVRYI